MKRLLLALALLGVPLANAGTIPVQVQATPVQSDRLLTMTGKGTIKAMPDTAVISGGVVTQASTPHDAAHDNIVAMQRTVAALKSLGIAEQQITTSRVVFEPQYERDRNGVINPRKIAGYSVTNRIIVTLNEKIDRAGDVFNTLIQNGANDAATVNFEVRTIEALENQARAAAAKDAQMKALVYAKALGLELGAVRLVSESGGNVIVDQIQAEDIGRFPDGVTAGALQRVPGVRIQADEQTIVKTVTVTWALK